MSSVHGNGGAMNADGNGEDAIQWQRFSFFSVIKPLLGILAFLFVGAWSLVKDELREGAGISELIALLTGVDRTLALEISGGIIVFAGVIVIFGAVKWRREAYGLTDSSVRIRKGVLFRTRENVPYARIQTVEVERTIVDRLIGMGTVKVDTGADSEEALSLGLLSVKKCIQLREALLVASAQARNAETSKTVDSHSHCAEPEEKVSVSGDSGLEYEIYRLTTKNLLLSKLTYSGLAGFVLLLIVFIAGVFDEGYGLIPFLIAFIGFIYSSVQSVASMWGARLSVTPHGVRMVSGLTTVRTRTIAPARIHRVSIKQGVLGRILGLWSLSITYPGMDVTDGDVGKVVLVPLGSREDIERVMWVIASDLGVDTPREFLDNFMAPRRTLKREALREVEGVQYAVFTSPTMRRIRWFSWYWSALAYTRTLSVVRWRALIRNTVTIVFHDHWQSFMLSRSPIDKAFAVFKTQMNLVEGNLQMVGIDQEHAGDVYEVAYRLARSAREKPSESLEEWFARTTSRLEAGVGL